MLDVVLLVACVLVALAAVLYIFFWNKLFALILSFFIRLVCWTRSGIWIEFGQVSPAGGFLFTLTDVHEQDLCTYPFWREEYY